MSFAKVTITGQIEADPEKRFTANDHAVTKFTLMVAQSNINPKQAQNEALSAPFPVQVVCWRGLAEAAGSSLRKGDTVTVDGKLMMESVQTGEGVQKKVFEVEAASIDKLSGAPEAITPAPGSQSSVSSGGQQKPYAASPAGSRFQPEPATGSFSSEDLLTEDDIPF